MDSYPWLTLAPIAGLAINTVVHVVCSRAGRGQKQMQFLAVGAAAGLVATVAGSLVTLPCSWRTLGMNGWGLFACNILAYLALAYGYFHFVNLNLASLRIRLLREFAQAPEGMTSEEVLHRYNAGAVIDARLERLVQGRFLIKAGNRYLSGSNRLFLLLFGIFEFMKFLILGRGNKLLDDAGVEGRVHPLLGIFQFALKDQFCRFILVGGLNTAFGYAFYATLILLGLGFRLTLSINTVVTILFNFMTYGRIVFRNNRKRLIIKFLCAYSLIFVVNERSLTFLVHHGLGELVAQAIALPVIMVLSFALNKAWVFRKVSAES